MEERILQELQEIKNLLQVIVSNQEQNVRVEDKVVSSNSEVKETILTVDELPPHSFSYSSS